MNNSKDNLIIIFRMVNDGNLVAHLISSNEENGHKPFASPDAIEWSKVFFLSSPNLFLPKSSTLRLLLYVFRIFFLDFLSFSVH